MDKLRLLILYGGISEEYEWQMEQEKHRKEANIYRYELQEATAKLLDDVYPQE